MKQDLEDEPVKSVFLLGPFHLPEAFGPQTEFTNFWSATFPSTGVPPVLPYRISDGNTRGFHQIGLYPDTASGAARMGMERAAGSGGRVDRTGVAHRAGHPQLPE